jgi:predicted ATPase
MRIYFSGCESGGKTTLARYVSEKYKFQLLPEVARIVLAERELIIDSLRSDIDLVDSYQSDIFHRQIIEEEKCKSFVSDRSLIDTIAYSASHSRVAAQLVSKKSFNHYIERLKEQGVILFLVRPQKTILKNDGTRETVIWENAVSIDAQIKLLLELYSIRYFQISTSSMQERIRQIDNILALSL